MWLGWKLQAGPRVSQEGEGRQVPTPIGTLNIALQTEEERGVSLGMQYPVSHSDSG